MKRSSEPSSASPWNSRSRPSRVASNAATHRIAGPICASSLRSGPTAKGMIATRMRKNTAPVAAPPPMRRAIRHSRSERARRWPLSCEGPLARLEPQFARLERRAAHGSPPRSGRRSPRWARMISARRCLRRGIERARRLVEQPERPICDKKPRQRDAPLSGRPRGSRRESRGHGRGRGAPALRRRRVDRRGRRAEHRGPEVEIFARGQRALERIGMAEIMRLAADALVRVAAFQRQFARRDRQQAGDRAQQARFAGAVASGDGERLAGSDRKVRSRKQLAAAALDRDIGAESSASGPSGGAFRRGLAHIVV